MRLWKPFVGSTVKLAALITFLAASSQLTSAQSPAPAVKPTGPTTAPATKSAVEEDIHDIRPPIHIPYSWLWAVYMAGGMALAGLAIAAWRWRQQHGQGRRKLLYELTLEQLEAARAFMEPDKAYTFSITVSEIVRNYIEQRFLVRAAHRTTEEFLHDLLTEQPAILAKYRPLLADFLEHCDLAKFARWHLSVTQMEAMFQSACTFVIETGKPAEPSIDAAPAAEPEAIAKDRRPL